MSHFAVYECPVTRVDFIKKGLTDMGLGYQEDVVIADWAKQKRKAELAVVRDGKMLPLGFIRNQDTQALELQADWFMTGFTEKGFVQEITKHHAKYQVLEACEENRWTVSEEDIIVKANGEIEIKATQLA